jgi:hypothetical protein
VDGTLGTASAIAAGDGHSLAILAPEPGLPLLGAAALATIAMIERARRRRSA